MTAMRRTGSFAVCVLAATLGSCSVLPRLGSTKPPTAARYVAPGEPSVHWSDAGHDAPSQAVALGGKLRADWWTLFRSREIDVLMKRAVAGSPDLAAARARLVGAREAITEASSGFYPQVGLDGGVTRQKLNTASLGVQPGTFPLPPNFNLYQVGATASYAPDLFGGTRSKVDRAKALADLQHYRLAAVYLTLTGKVAMQAIQVAAQRARLKAIDDIVTLDRQNADLVRKALRAGAVSGTDVVTAESQLAADETLRPAPEQALSVATHALAVLLGRAPESLSTPKIDLSALQLPSRLPVALPSKLVHRRPDILAAEAQLRGASADVGIATAQLYPNITLSGTIGAAAIDPGALFNPTGLVWSIAAGIAQPMFDGGMRRAERRAALAAFKASAADYKQVVLQAFGQVADILEAIVHDARLYAAEKRALDTASELVRLQRRSYAAGGTGILDLLDAERQYQRARLGFVEAEAQRYRDTVQLLVAMGGGWWNAGAAAAATTTTNGEPWRPVPGP